MGILKLYMSFGELLLDLWVKVNSFLSMNHECWFALISMFSLFMLCAETNSSSIYEEYTKKYVKENQITLGNVLVGLCFGYLMFPVASAFLGFIVFFLPLVLFGYTAYKIFDILNNFVIFKKNTLNIKEVKNQ